MHKRVWFSAVKQSSEKYWAPLRAYFKDRGFVVTEGCRQPRPKDLAHYDHIVIWNGETRDAKRIARLARNRRIPHWFLEVGFFSQRDSLTISPNGSVGGALMSEYDDLTPITAREDELVEEFFQHYSKGQSPSENDYILAPLQLANDFAIRTYSSFRSMQQFIDLVEDKYPDENIVFRPHPKDRRWRQLTTKRSKIERTPSIWQQILPAKEIVGINSTTLYEAALAGKKVTALGECPLKRWPTKHRAVCRELLYGRIPLNSKDQFELIDRLVTRWHHLENKRVNDRVKKPRVSICIGLRACSPSRRRNWQVVATELTALAQRRGDVEIIAAEWDGNHADGYPLIRRIEGQGDFNRSRARNQAWQEAKSAKICFCDSDIIMSPNAWNAAIEQSDQFDCFSPNRTYLPTSQNTCVQCLSENRWDFKWSPRQHRSRPRKFDLTGGICFVSRDLLEQTGGWDERFVGHGAEDFAFTEVVRRRGYKCGFGRIENPVHLWHRSDSNDIGKGIREKNNRLLPSYRAEFDGDLILSTCLSSPSDNAKGSRQTTQTLARLRRLTQVAHTFGSQALILTDYLVDDGLQLQWSGRNLNHDGHAFGWLAMYYWLERHVEVSRVFLVDPLTAELIADPFAELVPGKLYAEYFRDQADRERPTNESKPLANVDAIKNSRDHLRFDPAAIGGERQIVLKFLRSFKEGIENRIRGRDTTSVTQLLNEILLAQNLKVLRLGESNSEITPRSDESTPCFRRISTAQGPLEEDGVPPENVD